MSFSTFEHFDLLLTTFCLFINTDVTLLMTLANN